MMHYIARILIPVIQAIPSIAITIILVIISGIKPSHASSNKFYNDSERGWYYYESFVKAKNKAKKQEQSASLQNMDNQSVLNKLTEVQQETEALKARMVLEPSSKNTYNFMVHQKKILANADMVADQWQTVLLKHPELDSRRDNPISHEAIKIKYQEDVKANDKKIKEFAEHFKLILFFKNSCNYCHAFVPVLSNFAKAYNFTVEAVSLDNTKLAEFKTSNNPKLAEKLNITLTPTLIAYNAKNNIYLPVAGGYLTQSDLSRNVVHVYEHINSLAENTK